jgi:acetyltransferase
VLKDGSQVLLRPIRPEDAPRLQEAYRRLSTESIRLRFLSVAKDLTDKQAQELATLDYQTRMALVAVVTESGQEHVVAVARYAMLEDTPGYAECAVVVRDDYQSRGLGKVAMNRLIRYAREHGVQAIIATIHLTNAKVLQFIDHSGFPYSKKVLEPGLWEIKIDIGK